MAAVTVRLPLVSGSLQAASLDRLRAPLRLLGEVVYPDHAPRRWPVAAHQGSWLTSSSQGLERWQGSGVLA